MKWDNFEVAATAGLYWDYVLTSKDEIELIWFKGISPPTALFLVIRYWTLGSMTFNSIWLLGQPLNDLFCHVEFRKFLEISNLLEVYAVQLIHLFILYGMYGKSNYKRVILPLTCLWVVTVVTSLVVYSRIIWVNKVDPSIPMHCAMATRSSFYYVIWLPILIFEIVALILAVRKSAIELRSSRSLGPTQINAVLIRIMKDSVVYFSAVIAIFIANCLFWRFATMAILWAPLGPCTALIGSLGCRALLHIRQQAAISQQRHTDIVEGRMPSHMTFNLSGGGGRNEDVDDPDASLGLLEGDAIALPNTASPSVQEYSDLDTRVADALVRVIAEDEDHPLL